MPKRRTKAEIEAKELFYRRDVGIDKSAGWFELRVKPYRVIMEIGELDEASGQIKVATLRMTDAAADGLGRWLIKAGDEAGKLLGRFVAARARGLTPKTKLERGGD